MKSEPKYLNLSTKGIVSAWVTISDKSAPLRSSSLSRKIIGSAYVCSGAREGGVGGGGVRFGLRWFPWNTGVRFHSRPFEVKKEQRGLFVDVPARAEDQRIVIGIKGLRHGKLTAARGVFPSMQNKGIHCAIDAEPILVVSPPRNQNRRHVQPEEDGPKMSPCLMPMMEGNSTSTPSTEKRTLTASCRTVLRNVCDGWFDGISWWRIVEPATLPLPPNCCAVGDAKRKLLTNTPGRRPFFSS